VALARGHSRWFKTRVLDLAGPTFHPKTLVGLRSAVVWDGTGYGFFYVRYDPPAPGEELRRGGPPPASGVAIASTALVSYATFAGVAWLLERRAERDVPQRS